MLSKRQPFASQVKENQVEVVYTKGLKCFYLVHQMLCISEILLEHNLKFARWPHLSLHCLLLPGEHHSDAPSSSLSMHAVVLQPLIHCTEVLGLWGYFVACGRS